MPDDKTAADNAALIAAIPAMIDALEFYQNAFRYIPKRTSTGIDLSSWEPKEELFEDIGEKARAVLASIGKKP